MKGRNKHKEAALLEFVETNKEFTTKQAADFLNNYRSKWNPHKLHRYTQTTIHQLGALLSGDPNYELVNPYKGRNKTSVWRYIGEKENV